MSRLLPLHGGAGWMRRVITCALPLLMACGAPDEGSGDIAAWTVDTVPTTRIGVVAESSSVYLTRGVGATLLPDGTLMVADEGEQPLRIFSANGALLRPVGRKGAGPSEFSFLAQLYRCGPFIYLLDIELDRITVLDLKGAVVRQFRFDAAVDGSHPYASACNQTGDFAHFGWGDQMESPPGLSRVDLPLWRTGPDSAPGAVLARVPGPERWKLSYDGGFSIRSLPFGRQPVLGVGDSVIYVGSADSFAVQVLDFAGRRVGQLRRASASMPVTAADIDAQLLRETIGASAEARASRRRAFERMTLPKVHPAYSALLVDLVGKVWIREPVTANATVRWHVFEPSGEQAAMIDLPSVFELFEIGPDYLLGRYVDPVDDIPEIRRYTLRRGRSAMVAELE